MKERLVVVPANLAFAVPLGTPDDEVFDMANCMLIPHQRHEENNEDSEFIDYTFGEAYVSPTPVEPYDRDNGFETVDRTPTPLQVRDAITDQWRRRAVAQGLDKGTSAYKAAEAEFFIGAMAAMTAFGMATPPGWVICIMSGRPVVSG